ncbi:unnamed protein product, partial [Closterium sp. NIES-54]
KGQVVNVLIPWFRTVRLQLRERFCTDLPVLCLHSDRGGEFSSNLLREFCRGEGILQSFTLLESPQQNGIAERCHGGRSHLYDPCGCSPFSVAVCGPVRCASAQPLALVSFPKTLPALRWTGKVGDASVFRVWGSCAFVRDTSADKLSARAIPCIFLCFSPDAPGWHFYHPTLRRVLPSQDVTFDELVPFFHLFPYRSAPPPPPPLFLAPGPPQVVVGLGAAPDASSGVAASRVAELEGAESEGAGSRGAEPEGAESKGAGYGVAEPGGAEPGGVGPGGAEPAGVEPGGAELEGVESGGTTSEGAECGGAEPRGIASSGGLAGAPPRFGAAGPGASSAGDTGAGGAGVTAGAGGTGGAVAAGPGGARTGGTGVARTGGDGGAEAGNPTKPRASRAGGAGAVRAGAGGTDAGGAGDGGVGAVEPGVGGRRVPRPRPPPDLGTHDMALRPSSIPMCVPLPPPPESSLREVPEPECDRSHAANPTVSRLLATAVLDPASALVAELVDFAATSRLDYATALVAESETTLADLGFAPHTADTSLFLRTDTSLPLFYVLVYIDDLVFATADTEALTLVKAELQKRHTCTDLGELRSYLGLQITHDRARRTITPTQSHMVHQILQRLGIQFSSPKPTPLSTGHSLSAPPLDKSIEPSGP